MNLEITLKEPMNDIKAREAKASESSELSERLREQRYIFENWAVENEGWVRNPNAEFHGERY